MVIHSRWPCPARLVFHEVRHGPPNLGSCVRRPALLVDIGTPEVLTSTVTVDRVGILFYKFMPAFHCNSSTTNVLRI